MSEPKVIVYLATNLRNGKRYVGVTKHVVGRRAASHFSKAKYGSRSRFHCAIRKYGREAFQFVVLHTFSDYGEALECEIRVIAKIKPEYNVTSGGEGVNGLVMSADTRKKISDANKGNTSWLGKKHSAESIEKMRVAHLGNTNAKGKRSAETIEKIRIAKLANPSRFWLGKTRGQSTRDKISKAKTGKPNPSAVETLKKTHGMMVELSAQKRRKPVRCLNDGIVFSCVKEAASFYGIDNWKVLYWAIKRGTKIRGKRLQFAYEEKYQ